MRGFVYSLRVNRWRFAWVTCCWLAVAVATGDAGERIRFETVSTIDGARQTCYLIVPDGYHDSEQPAPLLVALHSWSAGVEQRREDRETLAERRGWLYLSPDFRGPNDDPAACGSPLARQDILDAVDHVRRAYRVDQRRIYLTGSSGGGHMTMLMAARHPEVWAAASAWVGISDLAAWHAFHSRGEPSRYAKMMEAACGGPPGASPEVDRQYRERSPIHFMHQAAAVPLDIAAGVHDGHVGSVPVRHSIDAFNAIAKALGSPVVSEAEIEQISRPDGRLEKPLPGDVGFDASFGRDFHLRRTAGPARLTIFEGGHEGISTAAIDWLARHARPKADE